MIVLFRYERTISNCKKDKKKNDLWELPQILIKKGLDEKDLKLIFLNILTKIKFITCKKYNFLMNKILVNFKYSKCRWVTGLLQKIVDLSSDSNICRFLS